MTWYGDRSLIWSFVIAAELAIWQVYSFSVGTSLRSGMSSDADSHIKSPVFKYIVFLEFGD